MTSATVGVNQRVAWLLSVARVLSASSKGASREVFVEELRSYGISVDLTRISRWESGSLFVPDRAIGAYEGVLGVPPGSFLAIRQGLGRSLTSEPPWRDTERELNPAELDSLFLLIDSRQARGGDWLALASTLTGAGQIYLPSRTWADLCGHLIAELVRSVGFAYVTRYEACSTLIRHPTARRHMLRALGEYLTHPDVQIVAPCLNLLQEITDQGANDLLLRLMASDNPILRKGAVAVAAGKAGQDQFADGDLLTLETHAVRILREHDSFASGMDALELATQLPEESFRNVHSAIRDSRTQQHLEAARTTGELVPHQLARSLSSTIATAAQANTPAAYTTEPDLMLQQLVRESLFHVRKTRRYHASSLIAASPYAPAVAHGCVDLISGENEFVALRSATMLLRIGHGRRREDLATHALHHALPAIRSRALTSLGMSTVPLGPAETAVILATLDTSSNEVASAAIAALGMAGGPRITSLLDSPDTRRRQAARWWTDLGPAVHD